VWDQAAAALAKARGDQCTRKLVDISDDDGKGPENTVWLYRELQERGVYSVSFEYHNEDPGFYRIFVHMRHLELAKRLLQEFGTKALQEANHGT
jgi:hypothetical protein